ncbi:hypothetical protein LPB144_00765 [Christiangramia salexigens]|uniref:Uncharacterized protein n=1 Tax=Christiangramia salexigens TaxID=1913577 RepID=A0A1L3J1K5_9FLAO|nr:hypothetical protein LPB144_00765 [Christiangramia salexigens]
MAAKQKTRNFRCGFLIAEKEGLDLFLQKFTKPLNLLVLSHYLNEFFIFVEQAKYHSLQRYYAPNYAPLLK